MKSVVFIITHGRANDQKSLNLLKKLKCKHEIFLVVDDMDNQIEMYKKKYGDMVLIYDKKAIAEKCDTYINEFPLSASIFARNACLEMAKKLNADLYWVLDDDITSLSYKNIEENKMKTTKVKDVEKIMVAYENYFVNSNIYGIGISEDGAYFGGINQDVLNGYKYSMCKFILYSTRKEIKYESILFEDSITCSLLNGVGKIGLSPMIISLQTPGDNKSDGGNKSTYNIFSEYGSKFLYVMARPDLNSLKITKKGVENCKKKDFFAPKILNEKWKKKVLDNA